MHVAAGAGLRSIHVGMRVDPDQADLLLALAETAGDSGDRANRDGVVAAEDQRHFSGGRRFFDGQTQAAARVGDLVQEARLGGAFGRGFTLGYRDVALVFHLVTQRG